MWLQSQRGRTRFRQRSEEATAMAGEKEQKSQRSETKSPTGLVEKPNQSRPQDCFSSLATAIKNQKHKDKNDLKKLKYKNGGEWAGFRTEEEMH